MNSLLLALLIQLIVSILAGTYFGYKILKEVHPKEKLSVATFMFVYVAAAALGAMAVQNIAIYCVGLIGK